MTGKKAGEKPSDRRTQNLNTLEELGFGPDSILMNDPKLFLDWGFLALIKVEFGQELGTACSHSAQLEIGRHHGLADAKRALASDSRGDSELAAGSPLGGPNLVMHFSGSHEPGEDFSLRGSWPEGHEARATLSRLGQSETPNCSMSAGYTAGWLAEIHDGEAEITETACRTAGDPRCEFLARIRRSPPAENVPCELEPLPVLPESVGRTEAPSSFEAAPYPHMDPEDDAVHAWGPVMVLPCSDPELAESTLLSLEHDPFVQQIRAVVIDLRGEALATERDWLCIERILKTVARWSAQAIFSGISQTNRAAVERLGSECLLSHKPLPEAIAMGFQVAEAQKHAV